MGDRELVSSAGRKQVFFSKGSQKAGSLVQGQAEGHTQGLQQGNCTGREKANNEIQEIRQEVHDRKSDRQGIGKKTLLVRMAKNYDTQED
jgi:flagellar biosynthesis/type III secretory pathway protein FliH